MRNNIAKLLPELSNDKKIVITTHARPDADALGSALGLKHFLTLLGYESTVIVPTPYPNFLHWMPGNDSIITFGDDTYSEVKKLIGDASIVICTDFSRLNRIDKLEELIRTHTGDFVLIDHHLDPEKFARYELWDPKASSASELVYRLIDEFGYKDKINQDIASCLYAGIMTDTGSFRFPSTTPTVHRILANLMETGIQHADIHRQVYDNNSESKLRLLGFSISSKLHTLNEYNVAYITLSEKELEQFNYQQGDTEGVVNYALSLAGINFAAIFMEIDGAIKISFRSVGDFSVANFSNNHFNGGGHKNAAGGSIEGSLENVEKQFLALLPTYKKEIINSDK